jgi:hypothetical protein
MRRVRFWAFFRIGCLKKAKKFVQEQATENVAREAQSYRMGEKPGKAAEEWLAGECRKDISLFHSLPNIPLPICSEMPHGQKPLSESSFHRFFPFP